jgi:hypothetical protein
VRGSTACQSCLCEALRRGSVAWHDSFCIFTFIRDSWSFSYQQGLKLLGLLLAGSTGQHMASQNRLALYTLAGLIYIGWQGSRVAGGSLFEFDSSFSLPLECGLASCGWRCPHRCLTSVRPFGNGNSLVRFLGFFANVRSNCVLWGCEERVTYWGPLLHTF